MTEYARTREGGSTDAPRREGVREGMARYVVVENTPGYLPDDDDPAVFGDHKTASEYLRELVEQYCDYLCEGYEYRPGYEPVVYWSRDLDYAHVSDPDREHDLGRAFEILESEGES